METVYNETAELGTFVSGCDDNASKDFRRVNIVKDEAGYVIDAFVGQVMNDGEELVCDAWYNVADATEAQTGYATFKEAKEVAEKLIALATA